MVESARRVATRVLLVSRPADQRNQYVTYLRSAGFRVAEVVECDCVQQLIQDRPDILVIDLGRSEGSEDGIDLTNRVRQDESTEDWPVIVLLASLGRDDEDRAVRADVDCVLEKPCPPEVLACEVRRVLAARRRRSFRGTPR
jgi:CheY-like chemotaxis protein